jgi:nitronate monooxygenase
MALPPIFKNLRLPVVGAPLFIISNPDLVIAQCKAGIVGAFPALNAREGEGEPIMLEAWLKRINEELDAHNQKNPDTPAAPFAVNQIVHRSNVRLERDLEICVKWKVPITITSLGAREEVNQAAHSYGGITLHDVINNRFAKKAVEKGADGLVAVAAGAGGHAGALSPFALIQEIRSWYDGPLLLSGAIANGNSILAAQALGADLAYIGSAFIATNEANSQSEYKQMLVEGGADDIVYTNYFTGVHGNYLKPAIARAGMNPDAIPQADASKMNFSSGSSKPKSWKDIWGSGQGIAAVKEVVDAADLIARLSKEYAAARSRLCG